MRTTALMSLIFTTLISFADAAENAVSATEFTEKAIHFRSQCKLVYSTYLTNLETAVILSRANSSIYESRLDIAKQSENSYQSCVSNAKSEMKSEYDALAKKVKKNIPASKALEDYYVSWLGYLKGIQASTDEMKTNYQRRQAEADQALNLLEAKLESKM